jgi:hypothetical protein
VLNSEIWTPANGVYVITDDVTVRAGRTLTIQAGTIVKFQYYGLSLVVEGALNVNGTAANKVYFTGSRDDTIGGDTNGDGGDTAPGNGYDWRSIYFTSGSSGNVNHAEIRYGGYGGEGAINLNGSSPTLRNVLVRHSSSSAISALPTDQPVITNFSAVFTPLGGLAIRATPAWLTSSPGMSPSPRILL